MNVKKNLDWLISPIDTQDFINDYLEKKPLLVKRNKSNYFDELLKIVDVDFLLHQAEQSLNKLDVLLLRPDKKYPSTDYSNVTKKMNVDVKKNINIESLFSTFEHEKATILINSANNVWKPLNDLTESINSDLLTNSGVNIFITPKQSQCFASHYVEHDLFILQIHGSEHWKIYESFVYLPNEPIPTKRQDFSKLNLLYEVDLEPGDVAYIPRGFVHDVTTNECHSMHITLETQNITWQNIMQDFIMDLGFNDSEFRDSVFISSKVNQEELMDKVDILKNKVLDNFNSFKIEELSKKYINKYVQKNVQENIVR